MIAIQDPMPGHYRFHETDRKSASVSVPDTKGERYEKDTCIFYGGYAGAQYRSDGLCHGV